MNYELWKHQHLATANPYLLIEPLTAISSAASRSVSEAFGTFGVATITQYQLIAGRKFYDVTPIDNLDSFRNDHPELFL